MPTSTAKSQGLIDSLQAAARYIGVLITAFIAILAFLKARDVAGLYNYIHTNGGSILGAISGLISLATLLYGIWKTRKRGIQAATPAANPKV